MSRPLLWLLIAFIQEIPASPSVHAGGTPTLAAPTGTCGRPVNKSRCLDSAAAGGAVWTAFCKDILDPSIRKRCFEVSLESTQRRNGFC